MVWAQLTSEIRSRRTWVTSCPKTPWRWMSRVVVTTRLMPCSAGPGRAATARAAPPSGQHPGHLDRSRGELHHDGHGRGRGHGRQEGRPQEEDPVRPDVDQDLLVIGERHAGARSALLRAYRAGSRRTGHRRPVPACSAQAGGRGWKARPGSPAPGPAPRALSDVVHVGRAWGGQVGADDGTTKGRMQPGTAEAARRASDRPGCGGPDRTGGWGVMTKASRTHRGRLRCVVLPLCALWLVVGPSAAVLGAVGGTTATSAVPATRRAPAANGYGPGLGVQTPGQHWGGAYTLANVPATRTASCRAAPDPVELPTAQWSPVAYPGSSVYSDGEMAALAYFAERYQGSGYPGWSVDETWPPSSRWPTARPAGSRRQSTRDRPRWWRSSSSTWSPTPDRGRSSCR